MDAGCESPCVMEHQQQPTRTSCGPTCIAMLVRTSAWDVIAALPTVRKGRRLKLRTQYVNVGEMAILLGHCAVAISRRQHGLPPRDRTALLRIDRPVGRGWHWAVQADGQIFDPALTKPCAIGRYFGLVRKDFVSWYDVSRDGHS